MYVTDLGKCKFCADVRVHTKCAIDIMRYKIGLKVFSTYIRHN